MKIAVIQVDGKEPNLALMEIFAWHKERGDEVTIIDLSSHEFDRLYGSKIFMGGSGYDVKAELRRQEVALLEKNGYSIEEYQQDLKEDRVLARDLKQPSAAVSATVAMGRSMGHDKSNDMDKGDKPALITDADMVVLREVARTITDKSLKRPKLA